MIDKLINGVLSSQIGLGAISSVVAIWLYRTLIGGDSKAGLTPEEVKEREKILLEKQQAEMEVVKLKSALSTSRAIRVMELQIVAIEALHGIKYDELAGKSSLVEQVHSIIKKSITLNEEDKEKEAEDVKVTEE